MQVVIIYESLTGTTEAAARLIADAFYERQVPSQDLPGRRPRPRRRRRGRLVIAGSWTDGLFFVGQKPAKRKKFTKLPDLTGKKCVGVLHLRHRPGQDPRQVHQGAQEQGAEVLGGLAIKRTDLADGAIDFVERVMAVASV